MADRYRKAHLILVAVLVIAWTVALLRPIPTEMVGRVLTSAELMFWFAKTLHVCAYAVLAWLGGSLAWVGRKWPWVAGGLVAHGALTEYLQGFTGRTSRVEDVLLDSLGIAIGSTVVVLGRRSKRVGLGKPTSSPSDPGSS